MPQRAQLTGTTYRRGSNGGKSWPPNSSSHGDGRSSVAGQRAQWRFCPPLRGR
jgi:hypothetical protein